MSRHAKQRAFERYGVLLRQEDQNILLMKIAVGDAHLIRKHRAGGKKLEAWMVYWGAVGEEIGVVVNEARDNIVTILPRDAAELERGRTTLGDALLSVLGPVSV